MNLGLSTLGLGRERKYLHILRHNDFWDSPAKAAETADGNHGSERAPLT